MRVLILSHSVNYWTALYAQHLQRMGHIVRVLSFSAAPIPGVDMVFIGREPWQKHKHLYLTRVPLIRRLIREFAPEVISASYISSNGLAAVLAWDGPIVVSAHGGDVLEQAGHAPLMRWLRRRMVRYVCRRATMIHTVSHEMDGLLLSMGIPAARLCRIPVGVDLALFAPAEDMPREEARNFICTRKHEPVYDNATIIDALARLRAEGRDFTCTFAGRGYLLDEHRHRAERAGLGDCVRFLGDLPAEEIPRRLRQAEVYISASLSDGASSALLEAMAAGLLPVVTRIPANEPWLEDGRTALFFEPGDAGQLARCLARAMDDADLRQRAFTLNRHKLSQGGDITINMRRFAGLLEEAVRRHRSGS